MDKLININNIILLILIISSIYICYTDIKYTKIRNIITFPLMIIGLIYNIYTGNIISSIIGLFIPFLFLYLGMGDVKYLMAIGSILGYKSLLDIILLSFILTLIFSTFNKTFIISVKNLILKFISVFHVGIGSFKDIIAIDKKSNLKTKMAITISLSMILKIFIIHENYVWNYIYINWNIILYILGIGIIIFIGYILKDIKYIINKYKKSEDNNEIGGV